MNIDIVREQVELRLAECPALAGAVSEEEARRVFTASEFVADALVRDPALAEWIARSDTRANPLDAKGCRAEIEAAEDEADLMRRLRVVRQREMVRIAWRDIGTGVGLAPVLDELTTLAEVLVDSALTQLHTWLAARHGEPRSAEGEPQRLVVLALGKLGSSELNFSSDIDLIFAFPRAGETDGEKSIDNDKFFVRLAQRLINVLTERTEHGMVYRVDMRLRPFGRAGALVGSFDQLEEYYQTYGRDWERFAFTRARAVAGDRAAGAQLFERLRPFVYRRYLDFAALESLREIKRMISLDLREQGSGEVEHGDLKRGWGGIREIEFMVQAFQLLRGAAHHDIQHGSILALIPRLESLGLMEASDAGGLRSAYDFLRTVENRLQAIRDDQIHTLPEREDDQVRLALGLGFADWPDLLAALTAHREVVRTQFAQVLGGPDEQQEEADDEVERFAAIWDAVGELPKAAHEQLARLGFADPQRAVARLADLKDNYRVRTANERALERVRRVIGLVLAEVVALASETAADPGAQGSDAQAETLERVLHIVESVLQRTAYLALLTERPVACRQLVRLCAASPWLAAHMAQHPQTFDELLDPRTLYEPLEPEELAANLGERLDAVSDDDAGELEPDALRYFQQAHVLRVAAAEISGALPLMIVSDHLTAIAETCLREVIRLAWRDLVRRFGEPRCGPPDARGVAPFGVVAYGKLGGIELSYGSDLDLVFVHGSEGADQNTDGKRSIDNTTFFARLGQRIIHYLSTYTGAGRLYEVDSRLRPSGSAGLLVSGLDAFARYQSEEAWTWEHQALVRARYVAGDAPLGRRFETVRREILCRPRDPEVLRGEVRDMRHRQREEFASRDPARFALKHDPGGIADIEFLVQYGALRWGERLGEHIDFTDNMRLLDGFEASGVAGPQEVALLQDAYRAYRARVHELDLQEQPAVVDAREFAELRTEVRAVWERWMEPAPGA